MEVMRTFTTALILATLASPLAYAQAGSFDPTPYVPRYSVALGYQYIRANAPPAVCNCFSLNGGNVSGAVTLRYWLRAVAQVTGTHGNNIGPLGQNLTLMTYTAGPQVVLHTRRIETFGQALFGAGHGSDSYFPSNNTYSTSATSFAYSAGGGVDYNLSHRFAIRVAEVQYLHTGFPNAANNAQNHLMFGAGIVMKFHGSLWTPDPGNERAKANRAMRRSEAAAAQATTAATPPPATPPPPPPLPSPPSTASADGGDAAAFHDHVHDAYFDYDQAVIRPDQKESLEQDAAYLKANPTLHVVIGGYSDERGSAEYNLALGDKRAQAARDALIANGVSPDQLETRSYGKEVQVCEAEDERCYQKNRRAGFELNR